MRKSDNSNENPRAYFLWGAWCENTIVPGRSSAVQSLAQIIICKPIALNFKKNSIKLIYNGKINLS